ncbi:MAG: SMP-30/gluconolactonase/LRE family protein [Bacteroidales bacterium]|nr:SMP-30/gluconolactonase/LRE family protein [Bacteroidales bacterium]
MALDKEGNIYVAVFDQKCIKVISPEGRIIQEIELPGNRPTNCAFVPCKYRLVVTEAERGEVLQLETDFLGAKLFENSSSWE